VHMAHGERVRKFLLGRINPLETEEEARPARGPALTRQRSATNSGGALPIYMRDDHAVNAAGWRGSPECSDPASRSNHKRLMCCSSGGSR